MTLTPSGLVTPDAWRLSRRGLLGGAAGLAAAGVLARPGIAQAAPTTTLASTSTPVIAADRATLLRWATDTWRSIVAMVDPATGLAADQIKEGLTAADRVRQSSPTNFGGYLWSCVVARDLKLITPGECQLRVRQTLNTLERMPKNQASGLFYNWYDVHTAQPLRLWPGTTDGTVTPFVSSVDNAWLGAALVVVANAVPAASKQAWRIFKAMRWDAFYDPSVGQAVSDGTKTGLIHGGFYDEQPPAGASTYVGNHIGVGPDVWLTNHHYDTAISETRITTYLGIATGQIPAKNWYGLWRVFNLDWTWQEMMPVGEHRTYYGVDVFEGAYTYRGIHVVPGWGGSMFEELMPDMFIDEAAWAPNSFGKNHPRHVRAQREHGMDDARYGYWGFSPSMDPAGGYREFGVDALGLNPTGYFSDEEQTDLDVGYPDVQMSWGLVTGRPATNPNPVYKTGVVTPHASFLAMMHEQSEAIGNLSRIESVLKAYGAGGFFDATQTKRPDQGGLIARVHLSLDQSMVMGSIANVLGGGVRQYFEPFAEAAVKPVISIEEFAAGVS